MKFSKTKILNFLTLICLFILFLLITAKSYASSVSSELANNVFRLHIIANSDSEEDQNLKLKVRDEIINYMNSLTSDCKTKDEVISIVNNNLNNFQKIAEKAIEENGYNYTVSVEIGNFYFPTKYYGNVSFPSGYYDALKIKIGEAKRSKLVV